jgi:TRAP-type mannitol/chloroaromatic compound transport system permease small subunit
LFGRVMHKLDSWISRASQALILFSGIIILIMAWGETYGVVKRYFFHAPDPFAYELSTVILLFSGVLAVAGVEKLDRHVRNDLVASRFPPMLTIILINIVFPFLALVFCGVLTWKSLDNAIYALQIGQVSQSTWGLPLAPIKMVIPAGYTLLCLVLIGKMFQGINMLKHREKSDGERSRDTTIGTI